MDKRQILLDQQTEGNGNRVSGGKFTLQITKAENRKFKQRQYGRRKQNTS